MTQESKTIYVAVDDTEFETAKEATDYEASLNRKESNKTFWKVTITQVSMMAPFIESYIFCYKVSLESKTLAREFLEDYLYSNFGSQIVYFEDGIARLQWDLASITEAEFQATPNKSKDVLELDQTEGIKGPKLVVKGS